MIQPQLTQTRNPALRQIGKDKNNPDRGSILDDVWQGEAFDIYDEVGEAGYVHNLTADTLAQGVFRVEKFEGGRWAETDDDRATRVMEAFVGPRGNQNELKRAAGLLLSIAGESYLVGTPAKSTGGADLGITWEFLSTEEIRITWGQGAVYRTPDGLGGSRELGKDVYIARMWRSHPRFSNQADAAMRRLIRVGREIITLTQLVDAVAQSRLNAGILFIPEEMSFASEDYEDTDAASPDDGVNDGIDEFSDDLIEHLTAPVENRASASSLVPLIMRGPAEMGEKIRLIELGRKLDEWAMGLRQEALNRLASGLDVPREILEGLGGLNHWTGFGVDAAFVVKHVKPKGDLIADFLTVAYLRPMLEAFENVAPTTSVKYRVVYDISALKSSLDEASNTRMVYDRGEASADSLRRSHGLDDTDVPTDEERQERLAVELMKAIPLLAPALIGKIRGFEDLTEIAYRSIIGPITEDTEDDPTSETEADITAVNRRAGRSGGDRDGAPPQVKPNQNLPVGRKRQKGSTRDRGTEPTKTSGADAPTPPTLFAVGTLVDRVATAADAALERAFERAGTRASSKLVNRSTEMRDKLAGVDKMVALTRVAPSDLTAAGVGATELFEGAWDRFSPKAREWIRAELEADGESGMVADEQAAFAVFRLTEMLDQYAQQHMHRPLPTYPNGLRVPDDLVVQALSTIMLATV